MDPFDEGFFDLGAAMRRVEGHKRPARVFPPPPAAAAYSAPPPPKKPAVVFPPPPAAAAHRIPAAPMSPATAARGTPAGARLVLRRVSRPAPAPAAPRPAAKLPPAMPKSRDPRPVAPAAPAKRHALKSVKSSVDRLAAIELHDHNGKERELTLYTLPAIPDAASLLDADLPAIDVFGGLWLVRSPDWISEVNGVTFPCIIPHLAGDRELAIKVLSLNPVIAPNANGDLAEDDAVVAGVLREFDLMRMLEDECGPEKVSVCAHQLVALRFAGTEVWAAIVMEPMATTLAVAIEQFVQDAEIAARPYAATLLTCLGLTYAKLERLHAAGVRHLNAVPDSWLLRERLTPGAVPDVRLTDFAWSCVRAGGHYGCGGPIPGASQLYHTHPDLTEYVVWSHTARDLIDPTDERLRAALPPAAIAKIQAAVDTNDMLYGRWQGGAADRVLDDAERTGFHGLTAWVRDVLAAAGDVLPRASREAMKRAYPRIDVVA